MRETPQPSPDRIAPVAGRPLVVGVVPGQPELVSLTAATWAESLGVALFFAYADEGRIVDQEYADGSVRHSSLEPDAVDDSWQDRQREVFEMLQGLIGDRVPWEFRYLAGRADRALTHLARTVEASAIVVGARPPSAGERLHEFFAESIALRLSRHQHRPVLVVPLSVVDWKAPGPWK